MTQAMDRRTGIRSIQITGAGKERKEDPWAQAKVKGPGEDWKPEAWNPSIVKNR